jgi:hypothetical protein
VRESSKGKRIYHNNLKQFPSPNGGCWQNTFSLAAQNTGGKVILQKNSKALWLAGSPLTFMNGTNMNRQ